MITIAVTGGMGAGKTETTKMLEALGAVAIHADQVAHTTYEPDGAAYDAVVEAFGSRVLDPNGLIVRHKLGAIVFGDPKQRQRLESIVWDKTREAISETLSRHEAEGCEVAVIEAAVLFEAGWESLADSVVTVEAPEEERVRRLRARSGLEESEIRKRISAQLTPAERSIRADYHISYEGNLHDLSNSVSSIWQTLMQ